MRYLLCLLFLGVIQPVLGFSNTLSTSVKLIGEITSSATNTVTASTNIATDRLRAARDLVHVAESELIRDTARGHGEYLQALFTLLAIPETDQATHLDALQIDLTDALVASSTASNKPGDTTSVYTNLIQKQALKLR